MLRRINRLIDSTWERDGYSSLFSLRQRLLWITPMIVVIPLIGLAQAFGASSTGRLTTLIVIVGIAACLLMFALSMYRWLVGYSRTGYQEAQAEAQRVKQQSET
jgi:amino acid transporter